MLLIHPGFVPVLGKAGYAMTYPAYGFSLYHLRVRTEVGIRVANFE